MKLSSTLVIVAGSAILAVLPAIACDEAPTHVYSAQLYEQTTDCLDDYTALDIVTGGTGSATCDPVCLISGTTYYVSRVCAPYPSAYTPDDGTDPNCQAALAAYASCKWCQDTGNEPTCTAPEGGEAGDGGDEGAAPDDDASD